jgi:hypothetical protein
MTRARLYRIPQVVGRLASCPPSMASVRSMSGSDTTP